MTAPSRSQGRTCSNCGAKNSACQGRCRKLPKPSCPMGYTKEDLLKFVDFDAFWSWMNGQTFSSCEGRQYSYKNKQYEPTECADAPHGFVFYASDVRRFIEGWPVVD